MERSGFTVLGVPVDCTGRAGLCDRAPTILRRLGVMESLGLEREFMELPVRIDDSMRDPGSGVKGAAAVVDANCVVRRAVEAILREGKRPILLGGCCSYLMGAVGGARAALGRLGLTYVDGHLDLYDGRTSPEGECADMPLAFLTGNGPSILDPVMGVSAPIKAEDLALIGYRDARLAASRGSVLPGDLGPGLLDRDAAAIRHLGSGHVANEILAHHRAGARRFWLHLDWDVLDETELPSADYLMPDGLNWGELVDLLTPLVRSPRMIGLSTACYNPDNDPDRTDGRRIVAALARVFDAQETLP
jgi:arginase